MQPFDLWRDRPAEWRSTLPPDEALAQLQDALSSPRRSLVEALTQGDWANVHIQGEIANSRVCAYAIRPGMRNGWRATLRGNVLLDDRGSILVGRFTYPIFTKVFMGIWTALGLVLALCGLCSSLVLFVLDRSVAPSLAIATVGVVMFGFGLLMMSIGEAQGRQAESRVREWVALALAEH